MANYYEYVHIDSSEKTIEDFINKSTSIARYFQDKIDLFLNYSDENGVKNRDRIFKAYFGDNLTKYSNSGLIVGSSPLPVGTVLYIPKDQTFNETQAILGKDIFLEQRNTKAFLSDNLKNLLNDSTYIRSNVINATGSTYSIKIVNENIQVWIWIRSLDKVVNITPMIKSINTTVASSGGSFNMELMPVTDIDNLMTISKKHFIFNTQASVNGVINTPIASKHIQKNDIIFIRYEKLDIETDRELSYENLYVEKSKIPNQVYDMIGLVDDNSLSYNASINEPSINITGRDFTKLLIEDGSYFLPYVLLENSEDFFINTKSTDKIFKRIFVSGKYVGLFFYTFRSIFDTLGFIFNQLTNTGVLPEGSDLLKAYPESKLSKTYRLSDAGGGYLDEIEQNGVWKIIKLQVDSVLDDRRIANSDISNPDGSLMEQIYKVCQSPFTEFWGDTYGDTYTFIARQPPFTRSQITDWIDNYPIINVESFDCDSFNLFWETEYYSYYQIQPQNSFLGKSNFIYAAYVPVVWLQEYVDVFGNHKKVVPCNYISYRAIKGEEGKANSDLFRRAVAEDLSYIIETTSYLPFTRKGTISIKGGDRRIKRGTFIYFKPTNEIYYVDAVNNSLRVSNNDIDRVTTLTVSRGMIKEYIKGKWISGKRYSYFDIVNTDNIRDSIVTRVTNGQLVSKTTKSNIIVDNDIFDYFIKRKQLL